MHRRLCSATVPLTITSGYAAIWALSSLALAPALGLDLGPEPLLAVPAACAGLALLAVFREAVELLGGREEFFCGGHQILLSLLGVGDARPPEALVEEGPYRVSRHPGYTAAALAYTVLALSYPPALPGALFAWAWSVLAALAEERVAMRSPAYRGYASRVPRFNPVDLLAYSLRACFQLISRLRRQGPAGSQLGRVAV